MFTKMNQLSEKLNRTEAVFYHQFTRRYCIPCNATSSPDTKLAIDSVLVHFLTLSHSKVCILSDSRSAL